MHNYYDDVKDNKRERSVEEQKHYEAAIRNRRAAYYAIQKERTQRNRD